MNHSNLTLPTVRLVFGILAILLSLVFSIQFVAQGNTGAAIISAIIFCVITEFCKVVFAGDFAFYWETNQGGKCLFSGVLIAILFALSISAAVFVLTIAPAKNETIVSQSDNRVTTLQKAIDDKKAQAAACNQSFLSKCVNPRTAELNALQGDLNAILKQSNELIDAKANAQFWTKAAEYLGTNPNSLQMNFAIARAVLLDLLGLILVTNYTTHKRLNSKNYFHVSHPAPEQPIQQQTPPPQFKPIKYNGLNSLKW